MFQTKLAPKNISNISNFYTHTYKLNGLIIETSFVLITLTVCYLHIQMNPARVSRLLLTTLPTTDEVVVEGPGSQQLQVS